MRVRKRRMNQDSSKAVFYLTHPEVVIDPHVPVPQWPLSEKGVARMRASLAQPWVPGIRAIYCSTEQKAIDGAAILAEHLGLTFKTIEALGENDRSATGYLPSAEFNAVADQFFAQPEVSIRGWERARDAQARSVGAVEAILAADTSGGDIAIVAHGGVGTLLLCHLAGWPISRQHDQPGGGGGNYFAFDAVTKALHHGWRPLDAL